MKNARKDAEDQERGGRRLAVHWAETEWFDVWLRLARREYHGRPVAQECFCPFGSDPTHSNLAYGRT